MAIVKLHRIINIDMPKAEKNPADYIQPLYINGLEGRVLTLPAPKNKNRHILFVYGSHSSIERWWGLALELNKYGSVTIPDLPGLGGMTSLYKIGKSPTIDNLAEYLSSVVKLKFRNKNVTIVGLSLGFVIATRMLQRYPSIVKKTDLVLSIVGFSHHNDFLIPKRRIWLFRSASRFFSRNLPAKIFRYTALQPLLLRAIYHRTHNAKEKFADMAGDEFRRTMDMEIKLWHQNDVRTQFKTYLEMFKLDNTNKRIDLPLHHVAVKKDRYFDINKVEENLRRIYSDIDVYFTKSNNHAPTVIATAREAAPFMPPKLRRVLTKKRR